MYDATKLRRELERDEGLRLKPYRCTAGHLTIGIGHNLDANGIPPVVVDALYEYDVSMVERDLDHALPWWRGLSDARQRALVNMCFNMGIGRLMGFRKMLTALRAGDWNEAAQEALDSAWAHQVGPRAGRIAKMLAEG